MTAVLAPPPPTVSVESIADGLGQRLFVLSRASTVDFWTQIGIGIRIVDRGPQSLLLNRARAVEVRMLGTAGGGQA